MVSERVERQKNKIKIYYQQLFFIVFYDFKNKLINTQR